jgi:hypothetical protein
VGAIRELLAAYLLLVLSCSATPLASHEFAAVGGGAALRPRGDLYPDPSRSTRIVETAPAPAEPARGPRDRLVSADGTLNVAVGVYADCSGTSPIDASRADVDTCFVDRTYFVGHSPGAFSPLLQMGAGALLTWYDHAGVPHPLRVVSRRDLPRSTPSLQLSQPDVVAEFQTCLTADGSLDRILDAVAA